MTARTVAFFTSKGGVGKTTLIYHLSWMLARRGMVVVVADLDPQADLTTYFLDVSEMVSLWQEPAEDGPESTIHDLIASATRAAPREPRLRPVADGIYLLPGELSLLMLEDDLARHWRDCLDGSVDALHTTSSIWRLVRRSVEQLNADVVLIDLAPSFGSLNRCALLAAEHVVIPGAADFLSALAMRATGETLQTWREEWARRRLLNPEPNLALPDGGMRPVGYVLSHMRGAVAGRSYPANDEWFGLIDDAYRQCVDLDADLSPNSAAVQIGHYPGLVAMSREARKPIFDLKPADGAFGGHQAAVRSAWNDFDRLADWILDRTADRPDGAV